MAVEISGVNQRFMRVYDGTSPTPFYVQVFQVDQPTIPMIEPRPTSEIQLDAGRLSNYIATYITNEAEPAMPVDVAFRVALMSEYVDMLRIFGNMFRESPWQVGGDTWAAVPVGALGTRKDSAGVDFACVAPKDAIQQANMINVVVGNQVPSVGAPTGTAQYTELRGVVITQATQLVENNLVFIDITAQCYGAINPRLTAWPAGNASTPS